MIEQECFSSNSPEALLSCCCWAQHKHIHKYSYAQKTHMHAYVHWGAGRKMKEVNIGQTEALFTLWGGQESKRMRKRGGEKEGDRRWKLAHTHKHTHVRTHRHTNTQVFKWLFDPTGVRPCKSCILWDSEREWERKNIEGSEKGRDVRGTSVPLRTYSYHNELRPRREKMARGWRDRGWEDGGDEDMKAFCWRTHLPGYFCTSSTWIVG